MTYSLKAGAVLTMVFLIGFASVGAARESKTSQIRSLLIGGTWVRHLDVIHFFADGTCESTYRDSDTIHGRWRLNGRLLKIVEGHKTIDHRIIYIDREALEMTFGDGTDGLHYIRN